MSATKPEISCPASVRLDRISLLAVLADDGESMQLEGILAHCNWVVRRAGTLAEAWSQLAQFDAPVLICGTRFPDGDWRDMLASVRRLPNPPRFVLISDHNIPVWAELLNLGGYDVLEKPLATSEVFRLVSSAWHGWRTKHEAAIGCPAVEMVA